jgi:hypothetical protein
MILWSKNMTKKEIANFLLKPWNFIHYYIDKYKSLHNFNKVEKDPGLIDKIDIDIKNSYLINNKSIKEIARNKNMSQYKIRKSLIKQNIVIKKAIDIIQENSKLGSNLSYFNDETSLSAYILGIILGDGCVHHNEHTGKYYLNVTCEDYDILESVNTYFDNKFQIKKDKKSKAYYINIWSKQLTDLLFKKYGLRGDKSHNLPWLNFKEENYKFFISGLHSTDGSNYILNTKFKPKNKIYYYKRFEWNYTTVCFEFIKKLENYIKYILPDIKISFKERKHKEGWVSYSLTCRGDNAIRLCDWMYSDSDKNTRCERKYQIYLNAKLLFK